MKDKGDSFQSFLFDTEGSVDETIISKQGGGPVTSVSDEFGDMLNKTNSGHSLEEPERTTAKDNEESSLLLSRVTFMEEEDEQSIDTACQEFQVPFGLSSLKTETPPVSPSSVLTMDTGHGQPITSPQLHYQVTVSMPSESPVLKVENSSPVHYGQVSPISSACTSVKQRLKSSSEDHSQYTHDVVNGASKQNGINSHSIFFTEQTSSFEGSDPCSCKKDTFLELQKISPFVLTSQGSPNKNVGTCTCADLSSSFLKDPERSEDVTNISCLSANDAPKTGRANHSPDTVLVSLSTAASSLGNTRLNLSRPGNAESSPSPCLSQLSVKSLPSPESLSPKERSITPNILSCDHDQNKETKSPSFSLDQAPGQLVLMAVENQSFAHSYARLTSWTSKIAAQEPSSLPPPTPENMPIPLSDCDRKFLVVKPCAASELLMHANGFKHQPSQPASVSKWCSTGSLDNILSAHQKGSHSNKFGRKVMPNKEHRFKRTADALHKSGLWEVAMKTGNLMKRNKELQRELDQFRSDSLSFLKSVIKNPENHDFIKSVLNNALASNSGQRKSSSVMNVVVSAAAALASAAQKLETNSTLPNNESVLGKLDISGRHSDGNFTSKAKFQCAASKASHQVAMEID